MKLLILGLPRNIHTEAPIYRGVERMTPYYCEELDEEHEVNRAFIWYCSAGGEEGVVYDLVKAKALVQAYRQLSPPQYFEIVSVRELHDIPDREAPSAFLGFDLCAGYSYSLLSWGLEFDRTPPDDMSQDDAFRILQPLLRLIRSFFQQQLNINGLFSDFSIANYCLECMMAVQKIRPGIWENEDIEFKVVGLWQLE